MEFKFNKKRRKTGIIGNFRVSEETYKLILNIAEKEETTVSEVARTFVEAAASEYRKQATDLTTTDTKASTDDLQSAQKYWPQTHH